MNFASLLVACLALVAFASAQSGFGSCQNPPVQQNFQIPSYLGVWYEITKLPFVTEDGGYCITANYSLKADGHVKVDNKLRYGSINGSFNEAFGDAYPPNPSVPAKLAVSFGQESVFAAPYGVLSTDYTTYSMIFSCTNILGYRFEYAWILSRTPQMDSALKAKLLNKFQALGVNPSDFIDTVQTGCKYN